MPAAVQAALLLVVSNSFMTYAWYGHLRDLADRPWYVAAVIAWGVAFFEYQFQVPANRIGYRALTGYQLKILQEAISLAVFIVFARGWLGEGLAPRHLVSFGLILTAVAVALL